MSTLHTVGSIKNIMASYQIGTVERVDFTPINKKPGFGENVDEIVMSAFVHFSDPILGYDNCYNYTSDSYLGNNDFWDTMSANQPFKLQIARNEYWICLKNKNPVQYTMMNIHQVVENSRHLENLVEEQKNKIQKLEEKMYSMDSVIKQLVGGLFCQSTQEGALDTHLGVLDGEDFSSKPLPENTHNWSHWPTTRQGDDCEKRIADLERYMRDVTGDICRLKYPGQTSISSNFDYEEQDSYLLMRKFENINMDCDNDSISSHSSMSDLVDGNSVSTHSSMPGLIDCRNTHSTMPDLVDDDSSSYSSMPDLEEMEKQYEKHYENRFRNSYEICGNE
jgi:hypothetical protein